MLSTRASFQSAGGRSAQASPASAREYTLPTRTKNPKLKAIAMRRIDRSYLSKGHGPHSLESKNVSLTLVVLPTAALLCITTTERQFLFAARFSLLLMASHEALTIRTGSLSCKIPATAKFGVALLRRSSMSVAELIRACAESNDGAAWEEFVARFQRPIGLSVLRTASNSRM